MKHDFFLLSVQSASCRTRVIWFWRRWTQTGRPEEGAGLGAGGLIPAAGAAQHPATHAGHAGAGGCRDPDWALDASHWEHQEGSGGVCHSKHRGQVRASGLDPSDRVVNLTMWSHTYFEMEQFIESLVVIKYYFVKYHIWYIRLLWLI